ncbi:MAG: glycosylase [Planctomycetia bacterium]|nr:glycosylase [Planctomycetia bacterium]
MKRRSFCKAAVGLITASLPAALFAIPEKNEISADQMRAVYEEVKTPYKYGVILPQEEGEMVDCPNVFRYKNHWYMIYVRMRKNIGYEGRLAESSDLLHWKPVGTILSFRQKGWDAWQASPSAALVDHRWGGSGMIQPFNGKYWITYLGGEGKGYEPDPLKIGLAWTGDPSAAKEYERRPDPIMSPQDSDARWFEKTTLYKTNVIWDREKTLGMPFINFYNAKSVQGGKSTERIGLALSDDMIHWKRFGKDPLIDNGSGISGDPQIVRFGNLWIMFYFGAFWKPNAFDTFAVSLDLIHWRKWDGPHLVEPSEKWDHKFAHKPWVIKHEDIVYHFYNAVGSNGRCIALALSKKI